MADANLSALCRQLGEDVLFTISRASKELFHTNLIGWIAQRYPEVFVTAFEPWLQREPEQREHEVRREWRHLDLVVRLPGFAPLVVEAKVFSLPRDEQLAEYSDLPALRELGREVTALLLTLDMPPWTTATFGKCKQRWTAVPLAAVAPGLRRAASGATFDHELIRREARLLELLTDLRDATAVGGDDSPLFMTPEDRKELADFHLDLAVQKGRYSQLRGRVATRYRDKGVSWPSHELVASASHGEALTSALWSDDDGDGVGWQLQGGTWVLAMLNQTASAKRGHPLEQRLGNAVRNVTWFDFDPVAQRCGTDLSTVMPRSGFNRYDPDFVYRSIRLPADVSVGAVVDLAEVYGRRAGAYTFVNE